MNGVRRAGLFRHSLDVIVASVAHATVAAAVRVPSGAAVGSGAHASAGHPSKAIDPPSHVTRAQELEQEVQTSRR